MKRFNVRVTGTQPLLMHNPRLALRDDPYTRQLAALTSKKTKTDADAAEMQWIEFQGGIYHDSDLGPYAPASWVSRALGSAAVVIKKKTAVERSVVLDGASFPLLYRGPRTITELYADKNFVSLMGVRVGMNRITRCRPIFREWELEYGVFLDDRALDVDQFLEIVEMAGAMAGYGDARRLGYGRFTSEVKEI